MKHEETKQASTVRFTGRSCCDGLRRLRRWTPVSPTGATTTARSGIEQQLRLDETLVDLLEPGGVLIRRTAEEGT